MFMTLSGLLQGVEKVSVSPEPTTGLQSWQWRTKSRVRFYK